MWSRTIRLRVGLGWIGFFFVPNHSLDRVTGKDVASPSRDKEALRIGTAAVEIPPPIGWRLAGGLDRAS
jgi:hypothetical protein